MKIVIFYQHFHGQDAPGHAVLLDFACSLQQQGHEVTVVAGDISYMDRTAPDLPWRRRLMRREQIAGVSVIRVRSTAELRRSTLGKLLGTVSFTLLCGVALLSCRRADVIYASSPPLIPMLSAWLASRLWRRPLVLEVRDLWPASGIELGALRHPLLRRAMGWTERFLYNRSERIVTLSPAMRDNIVERGWPPDKVITATYGIDPNFLRPDPAAGARIRTLMGWEGRHIVMYLGDHGHANHLEVILRAAQRLRQRPDILLVLIGNGTEKARLRRLAQRQGLANVQFHGPVPKRQAVAYINSADLCLATLRDIPVFRTVIPTKLVDYLACGKPVLIGIRGQAQAIVEAAGAGLAFAPEDDRTLASMIEELLADPTKRESLGRRGVVYAQTHFNADHQHAILLGLLTKVVTQGAPKPSSPLSP